MCVYRQDTGQHHAHSSTRTLTLQIYDTLQNIIGIFQSLFFFILVNSYTRSQNFQNTFQYFSPNFLHGSLAIQVHTLKTHDVFLIPFVAVIYLFFFISNHLLTGISLHNNHPFLCDPMAHPLPRPPSLSQKLHLSKVLLLLSTLV